MQYHFFPDVSTRRSISTKYVTSDTDYYNVVSILNLLENLTLNAFLGQFSIF